MRQPVSISRRIAAIADGRTDPSRSTSRRTSPRRRYSSSERNRSRRSSRKCLMFRHGLEPSGRICQSSATANMRDSVASIRLAVVGVARMS